MFPNFSTRMLLKPLGGNCWSDSSALHWSRLVKGSIAGTGVFKLSFGAFGQGMLGLENFFRELMGVFRIKPLKVKNF